jgi:zinc finger protein
MEPIQATEGEVTVIESMCPQCQQDGTTRLLFTTIPHFRQVIISSFECHNPECAHTNRYVQFSGTFPPHGVTLNLRVEEQRDLNRQVVKSENAVIKIPELDLEIPSTTQSGTINTIEGMVSQVIENLQAQQTERRAQQPEVAAGIDAFCERAKAYLTLEKPFHVVLDDPSGNSNIEALPSGDKHLTVKKYARTQAQREAIGLAAEPTDKKVEGYNDGRTEEQEKNVDAGELPEVLMMDEDCPSCHVPGTCKMHKCDIPFFKETIIMAFTCDACGYRNSEVRAGGGIADKGSRITLKVVKDHDLSRDVLKSETCCVSIPELDLELGHGTLGGMFTTVEGLLTQICDHLKSTAKTAFVSGDSAEHDTHDNWATFMTKLDEYRQGMNLPFTLVLDDPVGNIYVQNPRAHMLPPENADPQLIVETYTRTAEQDEELGITDMKTEDYGEKAVPASTNKI